MGVEVRPCECPARGWCPRHRIMKGGQSWRVCQSNHKVRAHLDQSVASRDVNPQRSRRDTLTIRPGFWAMVRSFFVATWQQLKTRASLVPPAIYRQRRERCGECQKRFTRWGLDSCGVCGCFLALKAKLAGQRCPDAYPRWREYTANDRLQIVTVNGKPTEPPPRTPTATGCGCSPKQPVVKPTADAPALLLSCNLCPGDVVTMTAAVRELAVQYPGKYRIGVRTTAPELWANNPYVQSVEGTDQIRVVEMHYDRHPYVTVNRSNEHVAHFIEGYCAHLARQLQLPNGLRPQAFKGDIHLSDAERTFPKDWNLEPGYWVLNAGTKRDYTTKQWPVESFQAVVDHFKGRLTFVQTGGPEKDHNHAPLKGVVNLVGRTGHRELIRLVHHAAGTLSGITYLLHLAAAVPLPAGQDRAQNGQLRLRPAVVVFGGREPPQWVAYPGQQALHTIGALPCCAHGGCWKSRTVPLRDGDHKDQPDQLCKRPVQTATGYYPECMTMITAEDVIRTIERYLRA